MISCRIGFLDSPYPVIILKIEPTNVKVQKILHRSAKTDIGIIAFGVLQVFIHGDNGAKRDEIRLAIPG